MAPLLPAGLLPALILLAFIHPAPITSVSRCDQPPKKVSWGPGIASLEKKKTKLPKL